VIISSIRSFVKRTYLNHKYINQEELFSKISQLSGLYPYDFGECGRSRLNKETTKVHLFSANGVEAFPHVTQLMALLFEFALVERVKDSAGNTLEIHVPNVVLYESRIDNCLEFRVPSKNLIRKYRPNIPIIASPVVLSSTYTKLSVSPNRVIRIDQNNGFDTC